MVWHIKRTTSRFNLLGSLWKLSRCHIFVFTLISNHIFRKRCENLSAGTTLIYAVIMYELFSFCTILSTFEFENQTLFALWRERHSIFTAGRLWRQHTRWIALIKRNKDDSPLILASKGMFIALAVSLLASCDESLARLIAPEARQAWDAGSYRRKLNSNQPLIRRRCTKPVSQLWILIWLTAGCRMANCLSRACERTMKKNLTYLRAEAAKEEFVSDNLRLGQSLAALGSNTSCWSLEFFNTISPGELQPFRKS